jgi:uncharacterized membrane protein YeiH
MHHASILTQHIREFSHLLYFFMILGVIAASISGAIRAVESKMDITGAILLAFVTANAGGTMRDLFIDSVPFWIKDQFYIWISLICGSLSFIVIYFKSKFITSKKLRAILILTDAMGLAAFSLAGVEKSLAYDHSILVAMVMGVCTAVGGGIVADVIANRVPLVFSQELYITVAVAGSACYLFLVKALHMDHIVASGIVAIIMVLLRLYSVKYNWRFPTISKQS